MGPFSASLKVPGDTSLLAATILIENGRLNITAGDQPIGDWSFREIEFQAMGTGFRMSAEGEQLLIEVEDRAGFEEAVAQARKRPKKTRRVGGERQPKPTKATTTTTREAKKASRGREAESRESIEEPEEVAATGFLAVVDSVMARAERRFGGLLPAWIFGRATPVSLLTIVVASIVFPSVAANLFLLGGLVVSALGAALYLDSHLAVRLLPGRSKPKHVLSLGLGILLVGALIAFAVG